MITAHRITDYQSPNSVITSYRSPITDHQYLEPSIKTGINPINFHRSPITTDH